MLCLVGLGTQGICQDKLKGEFNIFFSKGTSEILRTQLDGAGNYNVNGFYGFGLSYLKPLNNRLDLEAGINYQVSKIEFTSAPNPDRSRFFTKGNYHMISVPISIRANFLKYFFENAGAVAEFETSRSALDNQAGIGAMAGVGIRYSFTPHVSAFINPFLQQHALIPFRPENHQQRMLDAEVRLGIGIKL